MMTEDSVAPERMQVDRGSIAEDVISEARANFEEKSETSGAKTVKELQKFINDIDPENPESVTAVLEAIAGMGLNGIAEESYLTKLRKKAGITKDTLQKQLRKLKEERTADEGRLSDDELADFVERWGFEPPAGLHVLDGEFVLGSSSGEGAPISICTAFRVEGCIANEKGEGYGLRLSFRDNQGRRRVCDLDYRTLHATPRVARAALADKGLHIYAGGRDLDEAWTRFVSAIKPQRYILNVTKPGWHDRAYVSPIGEVLDYRSADHGAEDISLAEGCGVKVRARSGSLDGHANAIETALRSENGDFWFVGVASGVAGAIIDLAHLPSMIVSFTGDSSLGKSTAQQLGASAWGSPEPDEGLFFNMNSTRMGLEPLAVRGNGACCHLDEGQQQSGMTVEQSVFDLASGQSKRARTATGAERPVLTWRTFITLSEEISLETKIAQSGGRMRGGGMVRALDVDATENVTLPPETMAAITTDGIEQHYGHSGPAAVEWMVAHGYLDNPARLRSEVEAIASRIVGERAGSGERRAARILAVLWRAGEVLQAVGVVPEDFDIEKAVRTHWERYWTEYGRRVSNVTGALDTLANNVASRIGHDIFSAELAGDVDQSRVRQAVGFVAEAPGSLGADRYLAVTPGNLAALAGGNAKPQALAKKIDELGFLIWEREPDPNGDTKSKRCGQKLHGYVPGVGRMSHYRIKLDFFGVEVDLDNPFLAAARRMESKL